MAYVVVGLVLLVWWIGAVVVARAALQAVS